MSFRCICSLRPVRLACETTAHAPSALMQLFFCVHPRFIASGRGDLSFDLLTQIGLLVAEIGFELGSNWVRFQG